MGTLREVGRNKTIPPSTFSDPESIRELQSGWSVLGRRRWLWAGHFQLQLLASGWAGLPALKHAGERENRGRAQPQGVVGEQAPASSLWKVSLSVSLALLVCLSVFSMGSSSSLALSYDTVFLGCPDILPPLCSSSVSQMRMPSAAVSVPMIALAQMSLIYKGTPRWLSCGYSRGSSNSGCGKLHSLLFLWSHSS